MKNNKKEEKLVLTIFIISFVTINIIGYIFNIDILKIIDKTDNGHAIYFISIFISLVISIISDIIFKNNTTQLLMKNTVGINKVITPFNPYKKLIKLRGC